MHRRDLGIRYELLHSLIVKGDVVCSLSSVMRNERYGIHQGNPEIVNFQVRISTSGLKVTIQVEIVSRFVLVMLVYHT